jgi:hypothetical protein
MSGSPSLICAVAKKVIRLGKAVAQVMYRPVKTFIMITVWHMTVAISGLLDSMAASVFRYALDLRIAPARVQF